MRSPLMPRCLAVGLVLTPLAASLGCSEAGDSPSTTTASFPPALDEATSTGRDDASLADQTGAGDSVSSSSTSSTGPTDGSSSNPPSSFTSSDASTTASTTASTAQTSGVTEGASSESGAAPVGAVVLASTFDADLEDWSVIFTDPPTLEPEVTLVFDGREGDPEPGSASLSVPFTDVDQKVEVATPIAPALDLSSGLIRARYKLVSGLSSDPQNPGGIKLFAKSGGAFVYADGGFLSITTVDEWVEITFDPSAPSYVDDPSYDPSEIVEVGVELATGGMGSGWEDAVLLIDTIELVD